MHFNSIFSRKICESQTNKEHSQSHESVQRLLKDLGLAEYYPQKITYGDVIKLTEDALKDVRKPPSTLRELPWYFLRRLIGLDSTIRENGSAVGKNDERKRKKNMGVRKNKKSKLSEEEISFSWDEDSEEERNPDSKTEQTGKNDDSGNPSTLWSFMKNLFSRNSSMEQKETDDKSYQVDNARPYKDDNSFTEGTVSRIQQVDRKEMTENGPNSVHPLDLIYVIFLCADDFLRQELADKMSRCQYAVPFILPSADEIKDESNNTVLSWGLRTISRTYCEERVPVTKTLLNLNCPLVSCLSLNTDTTWKSRLLNKMLSPQQETFWHEGLEGGERAQKVSQGMVEIAWYLPAGRGHDKFETPVAFANLRGDANHYFLVSGRLSKWSTTTCIFTEKINKEVLAFLEKNFGEKHLGKVIIVVLHDPAEEKKHIESVEKLTEKLHLDKHQVISYPLVDSNFHTTYSSLRKSIETCIEGNTLEINSVCKIVQDVKRNNWMKVDDTACHQGEEAAEKILKDIDEMESDKMKSNILPCQSDLATREEIGKHEKEICRQKYIAASDLMRQYVVREEEKKWQLQWKQLQYPVSQTFTHFLKYIINFNSRNRKYFLQSLKLGLNERSIEVLQPLYEEYNKCNLEEKSDRTLKRLKELNEQLTYNSLGLEHFFREMAVMYENIVALSEKVRTKKTQDILDTLSKTMADILLEGEAIEILDGDVVHSPVVWLKAVLNHIEKRENIRVFKVSATGAQSSGKSTLLNTVFGLNFPVSSGRCTRGAYMQLVKLDKQLTKRLQCDYLLVIDSEGLMSRVSKNEDYDNELATFVIGLSDLTLVIIKGEGNEMQDVLPIAIHVFLRMNVLKELQACHFVHQNMGAVDVKKTMPIEINAFVKCLDEKTRAAAKEAWKKKYTQFTDVLYYDKNKDNTYVSGLLDGSPPMGKTDIDYSTTMQRLKGDILGRLETFVKKKPCSTLGDFSKWMEIIWEAVKYENFAFSFRNVLTVEAYRGLLTILDHKEWDIKTTMRDNMEKKKKKIRNELVSRADNDNDNTTMMTKIENMTGKVDKKMAYYIRCSIKTLFCCIDHYFHCSGCMDCNKEVRNRDLLQDYKAQFEHEILRFQKALEEEMSQSTKNLVVELSSHEDSIKMDDILKKKVKEVISKSKSTSPSMAHKEKIFDEMWKTETEEIIGKVTPKHISETDIQTTVQNAIRTCLGPDYFRYIRKKISASRSFDDLGFIVKQQHADGSTKLAPHALRQLRESTEAIVDTTFVHYSRVEKGREFEQKHAETLFKDIQKEIDQIKDGGIETTLDYRVDLMMYIEELAVMNFSLNQKAYEENRCLRGLLDRKKDAYHEVFLITTGLGNQAKEFAKIFLKITKENMEDRMTNTGLLNILRNNHGTHSEVHKL